MWGITRFVLVIPFIGYVVVEVSAGRFDIWFNSFADIRGYASTNGNLVVTRWIGNRDRDLVVRGNPHEPVRCISPARTYGLAPKGW